MACGSPHSIHSPYSNSKVTGCSNEILIVFTEMRENRSEANHGRFIRFDESNPFGEIPQIIRHRQHTSTGCRWMFDMPQKQFHFIFKLNVFQSHKCTAELEMFSMSVFGILYKMKRMIYLCGCYPNQPKSKTAIEKPQLIPPLSQI